MLQCMHAGSAEGPNNGRKPLVITSEFRSTTGIPVDCGGDEQKAMLGYFKTIPRELLLMLIWVKYTM